MKFSIYSLVLILVSCSATNKFNNSFETQIADLNNCWKKKEAACVSKLYGTPMLEPKKQLYLNSDGREVLTVYLSEDDERKIHSMKLNLLASPSKNANDIRKALPSGDWMEYQVPETNPHVVNLALIHFSNRLEVHFLTYKTDPKQEVKVLYWGGDYKNISI